MSLYIFGVRVDISYPLAAVMTLAMIYDSSMSALVCLLAVLIHEGGHLLMLGISGAMPGRIRITLFDISIVDRGKALRSTGYELAVVLAGITANLLLAGTSFVINSIFPCHFWEGLIYANLTMALFNGLPVDSLDGGQAVFLLLSQKLSPYRALIILDIISFAVLVPAGCAGFLLLLRSKYNFTLLLSCLYLTSLILIRRSRILLPAK